MNAALRPLAASAVLLVALTGCHISGDSHGNKGNVQIGTPFGSMHIKTNDSVDTTAIGIAAYPGAVPDTSGGDKDGNSADINMSFGDFHLGVKATSLLTSDSQDKVLAFYRKDLARYGDIITCRDNSAVGQPTHTSQGLTCDEKDHNNHLSVDDSDEDTELRTGSQQHQHIVGVGVKDGKTKIGLVALDLPSHLDSHDDHKSVE